jgi:hypothetical protein
MPHQQAMGSGQALSGEHDNHRALDVRMPHLQAMGSEQALGNEQVSSRELDNHRALHVSMCAAHASACAHVHTLRALGATECELSALFSHHVLESTRTGAR